MASLRTQRDDPRRGWWTECTRPWLHVRNSAEHPRRHRQAQTVSQPTESRWLGDFRGQEGDTLRKASSSGSRTARQAAGSRDREEEVGTPKSLPGANPSQGAEGAKRITGNDLRRTCFGEGLEQGPREAGLPPYACVVAAGRAAESPRWEERERWAGREPRLRRRSPTPEARATLSAGFGSGSVRRGGRGETLGADGAGFPGAPQLRGGEWPDGMRRAGARCPPGFPPAGGRRSPALPSGRGVSLRRLPGRAWPSAAAAWSAKLRGLGSRLPSSVPGVPGPRRSQLPLSLSLPPFAPSRLFPPCEPHSSPLASRSFCTAASSLLPRLGVRGWPGRAG